ncbi:MAG: glycosyltransferase family 2 protein, partial [Anaerolineae bacterium]
DTELREGALGRLTEAARRPQVGLVGPKLLFPDGRLQHSAFRYPDLWQIFLDLFPLHPRLLESGLNGRYPHRLYERGEPFLIDHPLGAAMMTDRSVVEAVGGLDPGFFMYCEEIDWSLRIRRAGYQVLCHPGAKVVHHVAQATSQSPGEMYVALHRSRFRLYGKHYGRTFQRMARIIVAAGMRWSLFRTWRAVRSGKLVLAEGGDQARTYREVLGLLAASES